MTICIASFASNRKAIAMIADKAVTIGGDCDGPRMQADSDVHKIIPIGKSGWNALISGTLPVAYEILSGVRSELEREPQINQSEISMMSCLEEVYEKAREKALIKQVLHPRLLTKELYKELFINRADTPIPPTDNYFLDVSEKIANFDNEWNCFLLVCGFDSRGDPHIFRVAPPGITTSFDEERYAVIGNGARTALARLLWTGFRGGSTLEEVLYSIFDAKAHSELIQGVGFDWDAKIMVNGGTFYVPQRIKNLLDKVFNARNRSPFVKSRMPINWQTRLRNYAEYVMRD